MSIKSAAIVVYTPAARSLLEIYENWSELPFIPTSLLHVPQDMCEQQQIQICSDR